MDLPLAAYGTMMPGCGGSEHLGLDLQYLGPCTLPGRLWLVPSAESEETRLVPAYYPKEEGIVQAHLVSIGEREWEAIDLFEDFTIYDKQSPYIRQEIETLEGERVWVYVANRIKRLNYLRDGDWRSYAFHPRAIPLWRSPKPKHLSQAA